MVPRTISQATLITADSGHVTPIDRLGDDVLYYIFITFNDEAPRYAAKEVTLSHVCQKWRRVAINASLLWTTIRIRCVLRDQRHPWAITRFQRARDCMVSLHVHATRHFTPYEIDVILGVHGRSVRRLSVVCSSGGNNTLTGMMWKQFVNVMPFLEEYEFRAMNDLTLKVQRDRPAVPTPFPFPVGARFNYFNLPWSSWNTTSITSLAFHYVGPQDWISLHDLSSMLQQCQDTLQNLEYIGFAPWIPEHHPVSQVVLPRLERLYIGFIDDIVPSLTVVRAPQLKSLILRDIFHTPYLDRERPKVPIGWRATQMSAVFQLMQYAELTELAIFGERWGGGLGFRDFILSMTKLKSLTLYAVSKEYYEALYDPAVSAEIVVPALSHLLVTHKAYATSLAPFFHRRAEKKLLPLEKLIITTRCIEILECKGVEELMAGAASVSAITDPLVEQYTVFMESEREIVVNGGWKLSLPLFRYIYFGGC